MPLLEQQVIDEARRLVLDEGLTHQAAAKRLGIAKSSVYRCVHQKQSSPKEHRKTIGDVEQITTFTTRPIHSLEDAIREFKVDVTVWRVKSWECTAWTTGFKLRGDDSDAVKQQQQYRVSVKLERLRPKWLQDASDAIYERLKEYSPRYHAPVPRGTGEKFLAVMGLFDAHFGKLAWELETGDNYDLKIADTIYRNAVSDMLSDVAGKSISRFVFPIGNDFFHVDNLRNTTTAGTPQDTDGRLAKIVETGEMAVIWAIEQMRSIAPVHVLWVPGNHDTQISYHLARTVWAWFSRDKRVSVDYSPKHRKYVRHGVNLLGFTHGNEEKHDSLPMLMANECGKDHAETTTREWLVGHWHQSRAFITKPIDTRSGTVIRVLSSLAGTDSWHFRKGYINLSRSAEVHLYGEKRGRAGCFEVPARW